MQQRRLEIAGIKLEGTDRKRFLLFLDEIELASMPKNLDAAGKVQWAVSKLRTVEQLEAIAAQRWQTKLAHATGGMVRGGLPYIAGLLQVIFQHYALEKLMEDEQKAMSHETEEARRRKHAGVAAFWGTVADVTGQGLQAASVFVPKIARGFDSFGRVLSAFGRIAGVIGAGIVAYWDGENGQNALRSENYGLAFLYFSSAALGFGAAFLMFYASFAATAWAGPAAWVMVALLFAAAVLIELFKENTIQKWLTRCWWGNDQTARYSDVETEIIEFKKAQA